MAEVSVVIPDYNEARGVGDTVRRVREAFENSPHSCEIIVVDDGSQDDSADEARHAGALVLQHPHNLGYGNSLLTGIRHARCPVVAITDADGTYPVQELPGMVSELEERGLDMLVGARRGKQYQGSFLKRMARFCFKFLAEFTCGRKIPDINSGLRVMRRDMVLDFAGGLCGGFSFTTSITIVAMQNNCFVAYRPIDYDRRIGKSHVRYFRDTLRTAQILISTILLFNPIKLFLLYSLMMFVVGAAVLLLYALVPSIQGGVVVASLYLLAVSLLLGFGFLAEQRRMTFIFAASRRRPRALERARRRERARQPVTPR